MNDRAPGPRAVVQAPNLTPPPGNPRFPLFDALRAIAALSVVAGHMVTQVYAYPTHPTLFVWAAALADEGVAVFFLISGFLLYRPFLVARRTGQPLRVWGFAKRRVLRIVPAYWAALTIFIAAGWVTGVTGHNWWIFYGFGQIYSARLIGRGIGVAWTLCIEVTFYALLPVFALVAGRLGSRIRGMRADVVLLIVLSAASLAFRAHYSSFLQTEKVSNLAGTFTWFALGMGLAIVSVILQDRPDRISARGVRALWPVASWAAAGLLFVLAHQVEVGWIHLGISATPVVTHVVGGLAALCVLLPGVFGEDTSGVVRRVLGLRLLGWVGLVSYAVYVWHTILIDQVDELLGHSGWRYPVVVVGALLLTLACAAASYYLLERPMMLLGRRRRARWWPARPWPVSSRAELLGPPGPGAMEDQPPGGEHRLQAVDD